MSVLRLINGQGLVGLAAALVLALLLVARTIDARHWKKQSAQFEQLYREADAAFARTVADYRSAAEQAHAADRANAERVAAEQRQINERTQDEFEARLADARARAERLRRESAAAAADLGGRGGPAVPGLPVATRGAAQAPGQDRLSRSDQRAREEQAALDPDDALTATAQAIQLDELIKWVERQAMVDPDAATAH